MSVFIVAELSANHGNNIDIVKKSIVKAREIGCDAIKIQTFRPDQITLDCDNEYFRIDNGTLWDGTTLYNLYKGTYLPWEWHEEIFDYAKKIGITLFSTPFDESAIELLEKCNNPIYKIASFEITDLNLIRKAAECGKPMVISTGIATEEEIIDAISVCKEANNFDITLLQCTSEYPARIEDANLATMVDMKDRFGVKIGLSDHTHGSIVASTAVALGACLVEKHFTIDKRIGGPDEAFSLDAIEFSKLVEEIRAVEKCIGKISYDMNEKKEKNRKFARSLFVVQDVKKGDFISRENVRSIRPGDGIAPKYLDSIIGKRFVTDICRGTPLSLKHVEE